MSFEVVNTYREAAPLLRRPFTPAAVRWKVQAGFPKAQPTKALVVAYIDARTVVERLNAVCPHLWSDAYSDGGAVCHLTIDGLTRTDRGVASMTAKEKGIYSDAFKRAAVKFGVGVSLYAVPQCFVEESGLKFSPAGQLNGLSQAGINFCREHYTRWLKQTGVKAFGEPLDHGDTDDSIGEVEPAADEPAADEPITEDALAAVKGRLKGTLAEKDLVFQAAGLPKVDPLSRAEMERRLAALTLEQGRRLFKEASRG